MRLDDLGWVAHDFGTRNSALPKLPLASAKQTHSARVITTSEPGSLGEGDALISNAPGLALGMKTADCLAILLADRTNRAVAAIHAGWRGAAQRIIQNTLAEMSRQYGTRPKDVVAEVGPGIGPCCFEVGPEVAVQFSDWEPELATVSGKVKIDLGRIARRQLVGAGVDPENVHCAELCTMCELHTFFSYRREREKAGRMLSWIALQ